MQQPVGRDQQHPLIVILLDMEGQPGRSRPVAVELVVEGVRAKLAHQPGSRAMGRGTRRPAWSVAVRQSHLGWQPSHFLTDRAEAERAFPQPIRPAESLDVLSLAAQDACAAEQPPPAKRSPCRAGSPEAAPANPVEEMEVAALGGCTLGP
jgi:hypothetical protein